MRRLLINVGRLAALCSVGWLLGCAPAYDRLGTRVELVPVEYQLNLASKSESEASAELDRFVAFHKEIVLTQPITLTSSNKAGKKLANKMQAKLLAMGVDKRNITQHSGNGSDYDLQLSVQQYRVKTEVCSYHHHSPYYKDTYGCSVEINRWNSMVHPENSVINP